MDGLRTCTGTLALAYAQLPVHVVTPVLDEQTNKQTNEQAKKQTVKHVPVIKFFPNFIRICISEYLTKGERFVCNNQIGQKLFHGTHLTKFI